jgi:hypothetical protein
METMETVRDVTYQNVQPDIRAIYGVQQTLPWGGQPNVD